MGCSQYPDLKQCFKSVVVGQRWNVMDRQEYKLNWRLPDAASRQWLAWALIACLVYFAGYLFFGQQGWGEAASSEQAIGEASRWCERVTAGLLREPANALSNIGFMVAGILMLARLSRDVSIADSATQFHGASPVALLYAAATIWLGPGSMLMHGTHTAWGAWADNLSMVMYILIPWLVNISEMGRWRLRLFFTVYAALVLSYGLGRPLLGADLGIHLDLFSISIGLWGISELLYRFWSPRFRWLSGFAGFAIAALFGITPWEMLEKPNEFWWVLLFWLPGLLATHPPRGRRSYSPWYFAGVACYLIAFSIWLTGRPGHEWCRPDSWLQAHAVWHLLSAMATGCFFIFLRTEKAK